MSVGIDVGSKTFRLVGWQHGHPDVLPGGSIPAVCAVGAEKFLVGKEAAKELDTKHNNTIKMPIADMRREKLYKLRHPKSGNREATPENGITALLSLLEEKAAKKYVNVTHATLAVPLSLTSVEKSQLKVAAAAAGFVSIDILPSNVAAALHWGVGFYKNKPCDTRVLVVDSGARFTSVSAVHLEMTASSITLTTEDAKSFRYGGADVDKRMLHLAPTGTTATQNVIGIAIEKSKMELASLKDSQIRIKDQTRVIKRDHLSAAAAPLLRRVSGAAKALIRSSKATISSALLVGGSSRLLEVREVMAQLGLRVEVEDFDYSASMGSVMWAANIVNPSPERPYISQRSNGKAGFRFFALDGPVEKGNPVSATKVVPLFEDSLEHTFEEGTWSVFQQSLGTRKLLEHSELLAYFIWNSGKAPISDSIERTIKKKPDAELGLQFLEWPEVGPQSQGALELIYVKPGSDADKQGLRSLLGWRLATVNGRSVNSNQEIAKLADATKCVFRFYREGLPPAAGDLEIDDITYIGWTSGGKIEVNAEGIVTTLNNPRILPTVSDLVDRLEEDASVAQTIRAFSESRNDLEAATLRLLDCGLEPEDLKDVCDNATHYFDLAQNWLDSDSAAKEVKAEDVSALASFVNTIVDAKEDDSLACTVNDLEAELNSTTPICAPGKMKNIRGSRKWGIVARKRNTILKMSKPRSIEKGMNKKTSLQDMTKKPSVENEKSKSKGWSALAKKGTMMARMNLLRNKPPGSPKAGPSSPKMAPSSPRAGPKSMGSPYMRPASPRAGPLSPRMKPKGGAHSPKMKPMPLPRGSKWMKVIDAVDTKKKKKGKSRDGKMSPFLGAAVSPSTSPVTDPKPKAGLKSGSKWRGLLGKIDSKTSKTSKSSRSSKGSSREKVSPFLSSRGSPSQSPSQSPMVMPRRSPSASPVRVGSADFLNVDKPSTKPRSPTKSEKSVSDESEIILPIPKSTFGESPKQDALKHPSQSSFASMPLKEHPSQSSFSESPKLPADTPKEPSPQPSFSESPKLDPNAVLVGTFNLTPKSSPISAPSKEPSIISAPSNEPSIISAPSKEPSVASVPNGKNINRLLQPRLTEGLQGHHQRLLSPKLVPVIFKPEPEPKKKTPPFENSIVSHLSTLNSTERVPNRSASLQSLPLAARSRTSSLEPPVEPTPTPTPPPPPPADSSPAYPERVSMPSVSPLPLRGILKDAQKMDSSRTPGTTPRTPRTPAKSRDAHSRSPSREAVTPRGHTEREPHRFGQTPRQFDRYRTAKTSPARGTSTPRSARTPRGSGFASSLPEYTPRGTNLPSFAQAPSITAVSTPASDFLTPRELRRNIMRDRSRSLTPRATPRKSTSRSPVRRFIHSSPAVPMRRSPSAPTALRSRATMYFSVPGPEPAPCRWPKRTPSPAIKKLRTSSNTPRSRWDAFETPRTYN
eukprot:TRINITY_DN8149_c0_g1_i1.p1 TRINITY_DN8149_c0_g1~~TRINITY_DN8149_c0_g1_i1.p1  ORF type:complete len:1431 (+),score=287.89 TRINITY_DN8149_c0_g1_i1:41-4333(+)